MSEDRSPARVAAGTIVGLTLAVGALFAYAQTADEQSCDTLHAERPANEVPDRCW